MLWGFPPHPVGFRRPKIPERLAYFLMYSSLPTRPCSCTAICITVPKTSSLGRLIRLSYQQGLKLAFHAPGRASSPLRPCCLSATSAAYGSSCVVPSPAPRRWGWIPTLSLTGTPRHLLPRAVSVSPNFLHTQIYQIWNGVEGGIAAPSAPLRPHQLHYKHAATAV